MKEGTVCADGYSVYPTRSLGHPTLSARSMPAFELQRNNSKLSILTIYLCSAMDMQGPEDHKRLKKKVVNWSSVESEVIQFGQPTRVSSSALLCILLSFP